MQAPVRRKRSGAGAMRAKDPRDRYYPQQLQRIRERARQARLAGEQYALYRLIIDRMWIEAGPIADDPYDLASELRIPLRRVKKLLRELADCGLIAYGDGFLSDAHVFDSIVANTAWRNERAASGAKGGEASARNRSSQRRKDAARETLQTAQKDIKFSAKDPSSSARHKQKQRLKSSSATSSGASNTKIESYSERVALASAREGKEWEETVAGYRQRWEAKRAPGESQGALKLGPVVIASNDAPVMDATSTSRPSDDVDETAPGEQRKSAS